MVTQIEDQGVSGGNSYCLVPVLMSHQSRLAEIHASNSHDKSFLEPYKTKIKQQAHSIDDALRCRRCLNRSLQPYSYVVDFVCF